MHLWPANSVSNFLFTWSYFYCFNLLAIRSGCIAPRRQVQLPTRWRSQSHRVSRSAPLQGHTIQNTEPISPVFRRVPLKRQVFEKLEILLHFVLWIPLSDTMLHTANTWYSGSHVYLSSLTKAGLVEYVASHILINSKLGDINRLPLWEYVAKLITCLTMNFPLEPTTTQMYMQSFITKEFFKFYILTKLLTMD